MHYNCDILKDYWSKPEVVKEQANFIQKSELEPFLLKKSRQFLLQLGKFPCQQADLEEEEEKMGCDLTNPFTFSVLHRYKRLTRGFAT